MLKNIINKFRYCINNFKYKLYYNNKNYCIGKGVVLGKGVQFEGDSGIIKIGKDSSVWEYSKLFAAGGKILIGNRVQIGAFCWITGQGGVEIEDNVLFADKVSLIANSHEYSDIHTPIRDQKNNSKKILIKRGSWLGVNVTVLQGVTIGKNCVIGANSVVTKDIPDYSVALGSPARVVKKYNTEKNLWELL